MRAERIWTTRLDVIYQLTHQNFLLDESGDRVA